MARPSGSPGDRLLSVQFKTNRAFTSAVTDESNCSSLVMVFTENSAPNSVPLALKICALIPSDASIPGGCVCSDQLTTKRPLDSVVTDDATWFPLVDALTLNSLPNLPPLAL